MYLENERVGYILKEGDYKYEVPYYVNGIYILTDPRNNEVRYVGKSKWPSIRFRQHVENINSCNKIKKWIDDLKNENLFPKMFIVEETKDLFNRESHWILEFRKKGANLLNYVYK